MDLDRSLQALVDTYRPARQPELDQLVTRARARRRTTVLVSAASAVALTVGIALAVDGKTSPSTLVDVPTPTATPTATAAPRGCGAVRPGGLYEYTNFLKVQDTVLSNGVGAEPPFEVRPGDLGEAVDRITCELEAATHGTGSPRSEDMSNGTAAFLPEGTPVYAVHGYDPRCRVAAELMGKLQTFVALDPGARTATASPCAVMPGVSPDAAPTTPGDYRGAPQAFRLRPRYQDCGSIDRRTAGAVLDAGGKETRTCILELLDTKGSAEMRQVSPTIDVGLRYEVIRVHDGDVEVWTSGYNGLGQQDPYWLHERCTGLDRTSLHATGCTTT